MKNKSEVQFAEPGNRQGDTSVSKQVDRHRFLNQVTSLRIIAYSRAGEGSLVERHHYATGGRGSGGTTDPLGSQGSLPLSEDRSLLFAVNAGIGNLSVFRVRAASLNLVQVVSSGGSAPVAIAQHRNLV